MKLSILFGQRKEEYQDQYAPEVLVCWDEYSIDENSDGFQQACDEAVAKYASEMAAMRVIDIQIDGNRVRHLLVGTEEIAGKILNQA